MKFESLKGQTLVNITGNVGDKSMIFTTVGNKKYQMFNKEESFGNDVRVTVKEITGDLSDLLNHPLLMAEMVTNKDKDLEIGDGSFTWTFYKIATIKGSVTIQWYGESNGYYSESVDFCKLN